MNSDLNQLNCTTPLSGNDKLDVVDNEQLELIMHHFSEHYYMNWQYKLI